MSWISKKNSMIALVVLQGAYLFGLLNGFGIKITSSTIGTTGLSWGMIMGLISIGLLYLVYDTLGSR